MSQGIGLLPKILSAIQPLLAPVERALSGLIGQLGHGLDSSGFKSFMSALAQNTGPAITKLGDAIGHIVVGIGGILKAFMPASQDIMSGLDKITAKFAKWGSTLTGHSGFQSLMSEFKSETPMAMKTLGNLVKAITNIGKAMAGISTPSNSKALLQVLGPLSGILDKLTKNQDLDRIALYFLAARDAGKKLKSAFDGITDGLGKLEKGIGLIGKLGGAAEDASRGAKLAAGATKIWSGIQAAFNIIMDANPIMLVVIAIAALVAGVIYAYTHFKTFRDIVNDVGRFLKTAFVDACHAVEAAVKDVWKFLKTVFDDISKVIRSAADEDKKLLTDAWKAIQDVAKTIWGWLKDFIHDEIQGIKNDLHWFSELGSLFHGWWNNAVNAVKSVVGGLLSFVSGIPGKILSALGDLGSLLFNAGKRIIQGLINGIGSMIGSVGHAISSIAGEITSHLPFSPAKKGPLSGAGSPDKAGQRIAQMLAEGMTGGTPAVTAAAARLAGGAVIGAHGAAGAGGGRPDHPPVRPDRRRAWTPCSGRG